MNGFALRRGASSVAFLAAAAFAQEVAPGAALLEEVRALRDRVEAVEAENARLRGVVAASGAEAAFATEVDRLTAREGTTVRSVADPVTLIGEFRFRTAASLGGNGPGAGGAPTSTPSGPGTSGLPAAEHDGWWTDALMRMGLLYDFGPDVSAYAEMRAKWAFGAASATSFPFELDSTGGVAPGGGAGTQAGAPGGSPVLDINTFVFVHQAWLETRRVFGAEELSFRVGRQEIALGNQFQFGAAEWFDGFNFDALRLDWTDSDWRLTALAAKLQAIDADGNQRTSFFNSHDDDDLLALYFAYTGVADHAFDAYWIFVNGHGGADDGGAGSSIGALGNSVGDPLGGGGTTYFHTFGLRAGGRFAEVGAGLDYNVEFAYQTGSGEGSPTAFPTVGPYDVDALAAEAEIGLTLDAESKLRTFVRALYAEGPSGNDLAYVPLYPSRHASAGFRARYGLWDLMPMTNVFSLQLGAHVDPAADWTLGATVLWAEADEAGPTPASVRHGARLTAALPDDEYGVELDVFAEYRASAQLIMTAGFAALFPSAAGEALWLLDGDPHLYAFLQARLAF